MFSPRDGQRAGRRARLALALLTSATLAACSTDVTPLRTLASEAGYGPPKPVDAPDFVTQSRRENAFMPVGVSAPPRTLRAKSADSQKALVSDLEGARGRNESRGRAAESAGRAVKPAPAAE